MPNFRCRTIAPAWFAIAIALVLCLHCLPWLAEAKPILRSGEPYNIKVWDTDDGLPQNSVIAMTHHRDGYLWLGTLNGLVRFDGTGFTVFDEANTPGLPSGRIVSLLEDSHGDLWIGTETAGAAVLHHGRVTSLDIGRGSSEGRLRSICEDSTGAVWLYTANGQLCRHREGKIDIWNLGGDSFATARSIVSDGPDRLLLGYDAHLALLHPTAVKSQANLPIQQLTQPGKIDALLASRTGGFWLLNDGRIERWATNSVVRSLGGYPWGAAPVSSVCEDLQGNLLVGTLGAGLFWYDPDGKPTSVSTNNGLSHNYVLSLLVDRSGTLWVGTDGGGLNRIQRQIFETLPQTEGLVAQTACQDNEGGLWVGYNGGGIDHWKNGTRERLAPGDRLANVSIKAILADSAQPHVWVGTSGAGLFEIVDGQLQRAQGAESLHPVVHALHQEQPGKLWAGTEGGLARWDGAHWRLFTTHDGLSANNVRAIAATTAGDLWVGTLGGGLNHFVDGHFKTLGPADGLPSQDISALLLDPDNTLWIGTFGSGLARLKSGRFSRFTREDGLISNSIGYLWRDDQGSLWIGSNAGLMRAPIQALNNFADHLSQTLECRVFGKQDGLPTRECTLGSQPAVCRSRDGKLWFPTIKGLAGVDTAQLQKNPFPPSVTIESVLIEGQPQNSNRLDLAWSRPIVLKPGQERVEIAYTSLNLAAPDRTRFRYWMEGYEAGWTEAGDSRVARYGKLSHGTLTFHVTACNEDGVWNPTGVTLNLIVEPPFWMRWWFILGCSLALLGSVVATVHRISTQRLKRQVETLRQQEALEHERARIARDIHDQLGASLTQITLLGEMVEADRDSASDVQEHAKIICQTARETTRGLDEIVWTVNPANDTLDGLVNYVCKYAQDYLSVAGLRYRLDIPPELPPAALFPDVRHNLFLASKEALTNIVRHAKATSVWLKLDLQPTRFTLSIEDDGKGLAGSDQKKTRNGLRNMRKRMEDIGGSFTAEERPGGGAAIRLTAPIAPDKIDPRPKAL